MRAEEFKVFELCGTRGIRFYFLETKVVDGAACSLEFSPVFSSGLSSGLLFWSLFWSLLRSLWCSLFLNQLEEGCH